MSTPVRTIIHHELGMIIMVERSGPGIIPALHGTVSTINKSCQCTVTFTADTMQGVHDCSEQLLDALHGGLAVESEAREAMNRALASAKTVGGIDL